MPILMIGKEREGWYIHANIQGFLKIHILWNPRIQWPRQVIILESEINFMYYTKITNFLMWLFQNISEYPY